MAFPWATRGVRKKGCVHGDEKFESMVTNSSTDQLKSQADFGALTMLSNFELLQHKNSLPETLPEAPYAEMSYSYFALTTFRSTSNTPAPKKFFNAVESFLEQTPLPGLRLCTKQHWELHYEFFHRDKKNEFIINIFGDSMTGRMQSCFLVEIHHHSGKNHVPFQNLAESIRQRFHMDYAFELPFLKNGEPSNRFRKCAKTKTVKVEWSPSELDIILAHIESPYADVRAPGWETLALITETKSVAQSLLDRKIGGRDALTEIQSRVDQSKDVNTSFVSHDQNRFILKTIKNMMRVIESEK